MVAKRRLKRLQATPVKMTDEEIETQLTELIEKMGGETYIREELDLHRKRWERMTDQYDDLVKRYPDQWIAIADREEPFVARSSKELIAILDEEGIDRNAAVMKFLRTRPKRMIL